MATPGSVELTWPQVRLLQLIYEPFQQYGQWPTFQHVNALAWHELKSPTGDPLEPRHVYYELSAAGLVRPSVRRDRTWELREETVVSLTLLGLTHLDAAVADVGNFVNAVGYIGERAHNFRPASPATPEYLQITSEEIRLALRLDVGDRAVLRLAYLLQQEAAGIWTSFSGPDPGAGWSLTVDADVARRYRNVAIAYDVLDIQDDFRQAYAATPIQEARRDVETSNETAMVGNDDPAPRGFISYSHRDQAFVFALVEQLERRGLRVWIDRVELVVGDSLVERIGDAIQEGDFVVGVISPYSVKSSWCQKELALAVTRGINEKRVTVLPIRLGDVTMPSSLTDVLYAAGNDPATIAQELTRAIETHLKRAVPIITPHEPGAGDDERAAVSRAISDRHERASHSRQTLIAWLLTAVTVVATGVWFVSSPDHTSGGVAIILSGLAVTLAIAIAAWPKIKEPTVVVGLATLGLGAISGGAAVVAAGGGGGRETRTGTTTSELRPPPRKAPASLPTTGPRLEILNRVTNGPRLMREDSPAYLSSIPRNYCADTDCAIPGTEVSTGDTIGPAVCQRRGPLTTNGDQTTPADNKNPDLFSSWRWYGIRRPDDTIGYMNEVWVRLKDRGGLGLPQCPSS